jgi:hypothetical protein
MSSTTARIGLVKEVGSENYSVVTVDNNLDLVDAAAGFQACTSSTRPSAPYNGKGIRETDTGSYYISNGSAPASGSWRPIWGVDGPVIVGAVGASAPLRGETTSTISGNRFIDTRKSGEAQSGWIVDFDGKMQWGPGGSTNPDTNLYRSAADTLRTDDNLYVGGTLTVIGAVTGSVARGVIGGRRITGANNLGSAIGATETMPTNLNSGAVALGANRRLLIHTRFKCQGSVSTDSWQIRVKEDPSAAGTGGNTIRQFVIQTIDSSLGFTYDVWADYETSSAVTRYFSVTCNRVAGTGTLQFSGGEVTSTNLVGVVVYDMGVSGLLTTTAS